MKGLNIRPVVPPEISCYPDNQTVSALENPNCIDFLRKNGFSKGTLLNWGPKDFSQGDERRKKSSIYIPSTNFRGKFVIIKFINIMGDMDGIILQSFQQIGDLDRFFLTTAAGREIAPCYFLFVISIKRSKSIEVDEKIEKIKMSLLSTCKSVGLGKINLQVRHVTKIDNNNVLTKPQKQAMLAIVWDCTEELFGGLPSPFIEALVNSTPQFKYLELSDVRYNRNEFELHNGFSLRSLEDVVSVFQNFLSCAEKDILFFPDFDSTPGSVLDQTTASGCLDISTLDGFLGEEVDFTEKLLGRLDKPKGLFIRRYSLKELNAVLKRPYTLNFEFDYIFCSSNKIYGIEVSRSKMLEDPRSCIERKLCSVFSKMLPRLCLILASWLYNVNVNLNLEQRTNFVENVVEFVIYFTNISAAEVKDCLKNCQIDMKKVWKVLEVTPSIVIQKVTILCHENGSFDTKLPSSYKLMRNDSFWTLEWSNITTQDIFSDIHQKDDKNLNFQLHLIQYLSGLLSFGFLAQNFSIYQPEMQPLDWDTKMNAKEYQCPNIILSPQQKKILKSTHRYLFLLGEPGSGKTMLLFAKALEAAKDPGVEHIVFFYPNTKTEFEKNLKQFIENANSPLLKEKARCIKITELNAFFSQINLSRAVVLGDELYFDSDGTFSKVDSHWVRITNMFFWVPFMKQCWITKTEAGQDSKKIVYRVSLPHFETQTLNVLFRCSWHIGNFCTSLLHKNKAISKSTAWAHGCTKSSQCKVHIDKYFNLQSLNEKIEACQELRLKFAGNRITVIFTNAGNELDWYTRLSANRLKTGKIFVANDRMTLYDLPFTGIEKNSVLIIIDFCTWHENEQIQHLVKLYNLAASRAQFELCIFLRDSLVQILDPFLGIGERFVSDEVVTSARLGLPMELDKILPEEQDFKDLVARANTLFQIAVERENGELARAIVKQMGSENIEMRQFLCSMDVPKTPKFLAVLTEIMGPPIRSIFEKVYRYSFLPQAQKSLSVLVG